MVFSEDWIKAQNIYVADFVISEGVVPYQNMCRLTEEAAYIILLYNIVDAIVHTFFDVSLTSKL